MAILIEHLETKKIGIAIFHSGSNDIYIVGANTKIRVGGDNFKWLDMWEVYKKQPVEKGIGEKSTLSLNSEALYVGKSESFSAIIYWRKEI